MILEVVLWVLAGMGAMNLLAPRRRGIGFGTRPTTARPDISRFVNAGKDEDPFPSRLERGGYQPPPGGKPLTKPPTGGSNVMPPSRVMDGESEMFNEIYSMGAKYAESDGVWANGENVMAGTARLRAVFRDFIAAARAGEPRSKQEPTAPGIEIRRDGAGL